MSWQESRCNAEGFGRPEPFFFLCEERTYSPPRRGGGISCGNRALCEADAASAEALWTMPHHGGAAVIVHADGSMFCFICTTRGWRFATPIPPPACENLPPAVFRSYGYRSCDTIFFLRKRNKNRKREDGENGWRSITWKRRWSAEVRGALQLPLPLI